MAYTDQTSGHSGARSHWRTPLTKSAPTLPSTSRSSEQLIKAAKPYEQETSCRPFI